MASRDTRIRERRAAAARRRVGQPPSTAFEIRPRERDDAVVAKVAHRLGEPLDDATESRVRTALAALRATDVEEAQAEERSRYRLVRAATALYGSASLAAALAIALFDGLFWLLGLRSLAFLVTVVLLIRWLQTCYDNTRDLGLGHLRYSRSQVGWGFFIPILNLYRPYRALADLHRESDPSRLPLLPVVETSELATYRAAPGLTRRAPREPRELRFPIAVFWGGYLVSSFVGEYYPLTLAFGGVVCFALLAVIVAIGRRREELYLRVQDLAHLTSGDEG